MATLQETQFNNEAWLACVRDQAHRKEATDIAAGYTARKVREQGFMRKVMEPVDVKDSDLNRLPSDDKPSVTVDIEPDNMLAMSVPYNNEPQTVWMNCNRYLVTGSRMMTPKIVLNEMQLRTYRFDVKDVFAKNMVRDALLVEDTMGVSAINALLGSAAGQVLPLVGVAMWRTVQGGISRESVAESRLFGGTTKFKIASQNAIANYYTVGQFAKWGRDEAGGDMAETALTDGWYKTKIMGLDWLGTIKNEIIPDFRVYYFGGKEFLGKSVMFNPARMHVEEKYWWYSMFVEYCMGTTFANPAAISIVDHQQ